MFWILYLVPNHMADIFAHHLPQELVDIIKEFSGEGLWRNGTFISIGRIAKNDPRYAILQSRSLIEQVHTENKVSMRQPVLSRLALINPEGKRIVIRLRYMPISKHYSMYQYEIYHKNILTLFIIR
jgi:hypothetical protein